MRDRARIDQLARSSREADRHAAIVALRDIRGPEASRILVSLIVNERERRKEEQDLWMTEKGGELWFLPTLGPHKHPIFYEAVRLLMDRNDDAALRAAYAQLGEKEEDARRYLLGAIGNYPGEENRKLFLGVLDEALVKGKVDELSEGDSALGRRPLVEKAVIGLRRHPGPGSAGRIVKMLETMQGMDNELTANLFYALEQHKEPKTVLMMERLSTRSIGYARHVALSLRHLDLPSTRSLLTSLAEHADATVARHARESLAHLSAKAVKPRTR